MNVGDVTLNIVRDIQRQTFDVLLLIGRHLHRGSADFNLSPRRNVPFKFESEVYRFGPDRTLNFRKCSWLRIFGLVPRSIRDRIYDIVAINRLRWFGEE